MHVVEAGSHPGQLRVAHLHIFDRTSSETILEVIEALRFIRVRNLDARQARVLADARMHIGDRFGNQNHEVVGFKQPRISHPALQRDERVAVIVSEIADFARWHNRIEEIDNHGYVVIVIEVTLNERQRARRIARQFFLFQSKGQIRHALLRDESALGLVRAEDDALASVVEHNAFIAEHAFLQKVEQ